MPIHRTLPSAGVPIQLWTDEVDEPSLRQLANTAGLPFVFHHVAAMPDVHLGIGATVGSVVATRGAVVPAAVGVDIGCGMLAVRTTLAASEMPDTLAPLRGAIEDRGPVGLGMHVRHQARRGHAELGHDHGPPRLRGWYARRCAQCRARLRCEQRR